MYSLEHSLPGTEEAPFGQRIHFAEPSKFPLATRTLSLPMHLCSVFSERSSICIHRFRGVNAYVPSSHLILLYHAPAQTSSNLPGILLKKLFHRFFPSRGFRFIDESRRIGVIMM